MKELQVSVREAARLWAFDVKCPNDLRMHKQWNCDRTFGPFAAFKKPDVLYCVVAEVAFASGCYITR